jgi:hypothetical protein
MFAYLVFGVVVPPHPTHTLLFRVGWWWIVQNIFQKAEFVSLVFKAAMQAVLG